MKMLIRCAAICSALLLSTGCSVKRVAINKLGNALASGGSTFTSDDDPELVEAAIPFVPADVNLDGKMDLVIAAATGVSVLLGNGDGTFQPPIQDVALTGFGLAIGDFNGDGIPDIAACDFHDMAVLVALGNGDGTFQAPSAMGLDGQHPQYIAVGDFNNDGKLDVATADLNGPVSILLGN